MLIKNTQSIGEIIRQNRKSQGLTQRDLALACGTGERFIVELEKGKPSCEIEKVLLVLNTLGIKIELISPNGE